MGVFSLSDGAGGPEIRTGPNMRAIVRALWLLPRIGYTFWEVPWWPGSFQLHLEPMAAFIYSPTDTYLLGVNLNLRHTFLIWRRFSPYIEGGAGILNTNLRVGRALGETIEFIEHAGAGFHLHISGRISLSAGYRWTHISNAGLDERNSGINSHFPYLGFTYFF